MPLPAFRNKYILPAIAGADLERQYRTGVLGHAWGFDWFMEPEKVYRFMSNREMEELKLTLITSPSFS